MIPYKQIAIAVVKLLRKNNIPSWVAGGVAVDIYSNTNRYHKDIDIFVSDYRYMNKVVRILRNAGFRLTSENRPHRVYMVGNVICNNNKYRVGLDIFFKTLFFGLFEPEPDMNSYTVDIETLLKGMYDKKTRTEKALYRANEDISLLQNCLSSPEKYKYNVGIANVVGVLNE